MTVTLTRRRENGVHVLTWTDDADGVSHTAWLADWQVAVMEQAGLDPGETFTPHAWACIDAERANRRFFEQFVKPLADRLGWASP